MIRDLNVLIKDEILYEKKCIIWGAGCSGKLLYRAMLKLGIQKETLFLCDSRAIEIDKEEVDNVLDIKQVVDMVISSPNEYLIVVSVRAMEVQDEIIEQIKEIGLWDVDICTLFAVQWAILFEARKKGINLHESEVGRRSWGKQFMLLRELGIKVNYMVLAPYLEQLIFVYQPGKVGSSTICSSLKNYGLQSLHVHTLQDLHYTKEIMQQRGGKIISAIRNPLEWRISQFWQVFEQRFFDNVYADFDTLQSTFFDKDFKEEEYRWFENEMNRVMGINVFEHPFNREQGYTIIRKDNIELLLIVTEKMNTLEDVIGEFIGVKNFRLCNTNISEEREYRFVYEQYKKKFVISNDIFESICMDNRLRYFYTEEAIQRFKQKWQSQIVFGEQNKTIGVQSDCV